MLQQTTRRSHCESLLRLVRHYAIRLALHPTVTSSTYTTETGPSCCCCCLSRERICSRSAIGRQSLNTFSLFIRIDTCDHQRMAITTCHAVDVDFAQRLHFLRHGRRLRLIVAISLTTEITLPALTSFAMAIVERSQ